MNLGIEGRKAAVAASSAGLGFQCAAALIEAGVRVAICGRDPDRLAKAADELGPNAVAVGCDVSTAAGATSFVDQASELLGGVDILIPNAGGPPPGQARHISIDQIHDAVESNLVSTVAMCAAATDQMCGNGWGRIVAITSVSVRQPIANLALSNLARAGVTGYLKTLATELAPHGVTVNSVQPGLHATDRLVQLHPDGFGSLAQSIPARRLGSPVDFGRFVAFLASEHAGFITGAAIPVDGGQSFGLQ